jgi:hypothetical protein
MFDIGGTLRQGREQKGLSLEEVEEATRMRARQLRALEEERFDLFPSGFYARSFLRGYGEFLGLDANLLVEEYRERVEPAEEPPPPPPRRRWPRIEPRRAAWGLGIAAAIAAVPLAWTSGGSHRNVPVATPAPLRVVHRARPVVRPTRHATAPVKRTAPSILLAATRGDCWLLVRAGSARGPLLYEGILAAGRKLVFARRFLYVRAGASWNLDLRLNGKALPTLDPSGAPVDLLLTPSGRHVL